MATHAEWSRAYARQADADFRALQTLESALFDPPIRLAACHKLQFLQMACEKLVKAHLCSEGTAPESLQSSHAYVARTLPVVLRQTMRTLRLSGRQTRWLSMRIRHISREIELLAPAVTGGGARPDNCEYPWEDANGTLRIPLEWSFAPTQLLSEPAGRTFLKLVAASIVELL